jgi:hypothetical protein
MLRERQDRAFNDGYLQTRLGGMGNHYDIGQA